MRARLSIVVVAASMSACASGLHPHTTLAGRPFPAARTADLREGQTLDQVGAILGEPLEVSETADGAVWRYYEKAHPRGCTSYLFGVLSLGGRPEWLDEAVVTFRSERVAGVSVRRQREREASRWEIPGRP